ncbi:hypothetical protein [Streptomyces violaceusniger]|uniref:hypothetical protein n=1 Tax=Streptomyces violaceusniger TaxID=68280 RepID=UPI0012374CFE|nr:hypothetical protein [Streptomyces violaceusniger]
MRDTQGKVREHCCGGDSRLDRILTQAMADGTVVSAGRLHDKDEDEGGRANVLQHATIALDPREHFPTPSRHQCRPAPAHRPRPARARHGHGDPRACGRSSPRPPRRSRAAEPA